ncbi:unnamed protein product [Camellia sinensis]
MAASGTAEIQQDGKTIKTYSIFLSILHNAKKTIDMSCSDKLCKQLYTGVFLEDKKLGILSTRRGTRIASCYLQGNLIYVGVIILIIGNGPMRRQDIDKNAMKFKMKPLEHVELMLRVYEGATTTGNFAWTPGADFDLVATDDMPSFMDAEDYEDSSGLPPFQPVANSEHTVEGCDASMEQTPTGGPMKQKFGGSIQGLQKKGQSEGASKLASSMENLVLSVKSQQREVRVHHDYPHLTPEVIGKCLARLHSLNGLGLDDRLIPFAVSLMDNPANQAIMLQFSTDDTVISWLRIEQPQISRGPSGPTHGSKMRGWC